MRKEHAKEREREEYYDDEDKERDKTSPQPSSSNADSLSIEETNKLRAKLGLKPLEVAEKPAGNFFLNIFVYSI